MDYSPWSEGKFWPFLKANKRSHNSETKEAMPTKIGFHAFHVNLYLHEFSELILFFDPHGLYVTCMHTNFGGRGHSGFGDTATLKNGQISLSDHGL